MLDKSTFVPKLLKRLAYTQDLESLTNELLANIGKETGADRTYIFELNNNSGNWDNTHEWCKEGISPEIDNLQNVPDEIIEVWVREFKKSNKVIIHDLEAYRSESQSMYDVLKPQGIHSLVVCPLEIQGKYVGFFGVDNPPAKGVEDITGILSELQYILVIMLRYRELTLELSRISFIDALTGAKNRNALMHEKRKIEQEACIGFVLCDSNGLKEVNDTQGHEAGDRLICKTAEAMFEVFGKGHVYRIGGDEFVAYGQYDSEAEFLDRLGQVKSAFQTKDVRVAMGYVFSHDVNVEIRELLQKADAQMYADKRKFYESGTFCDRRKNRR